jgi:hypothetical protein
VRKLFDTSYKLKAMKVAENHKKEPARRCVHSCGQEPAQYYINKRRSRLDTGLVLKPDLESQEGNRSPDFYSRIYGTSTAFVWYLLHAVTPPIT